MPLISDQDYDIALNAQRIKDLNAANDGNKADVKKVVIRLTVIMIQKYVTYLVLFIVSFFLVYKPKFSKNCCLSWNKRYLFSQ